MDGIVVINKPEGFTSMDCVAVIRGISKERHVGHTGTLDPNVTGVLPICLGKATRYIEFMDIAEKEYVCKAVLGKKSDTQDIWGEVSEVICKFPDENTFMNTLDTFVGEIDQIPPLFSAIKIDGRAAYKYARSGKTPEIKPRKAIIRSISDVYYNKNTGEYSFRILCGRGTYIRTICNDLGEKLGTGSVMTSLVRTKACGYSIEEALNFADFRSWTIDDIVQNLKTCDSGLGSMRRLQIPPHRGEKFINGLSSRVKHVDPNTEFYSVYAEDVFLGIGKLTKDDGGFIINPYKVFK